MVVLLSSAGETGAHTNYIHQVTYPEAKRLTNELEF